MRLARLIRVGICGSAACLGAWASGGTAGPLEVEMYRGSFATVNSFIFSNGTTQLVLDVQRKSLEAAHLIERVQARGLPLGTVLISHGHTDHFTGMPLFRDTFPGVRIVVANEAIRRDIKAYAIYMDSGGETGAEPALEPALKPKTAQKPGGFDYERTIEVLQGARLTLEGGGTLELDTDYLPAEADHTTTVYSPELNALFLADLGYNKVHLWLGDDISREDIANWRAEMLRLKARYATRNPAVYPGHGDVTDMSLFDAMVRYIDDFLRITAVAASRAGAMQQMIALYPDWAEADFFLKYSIEHHVPM